MADDYGTDAREEVFKALGHTPLWMLFREVLSYDQLLEALSFFLVRVPEREAEGDKPERPASTLYPRYHQSRLVRRVAADIGTSGKRSSI